MPGYEPDIVKAQGPRDPTDVCDICFEEIEPHRFTTIHTPCRSLCHETCLEMWHDNRRARESEFTCPRCQRRVKTPEEEMYDYELRLPSKSYSPDVFPSPAFYTLRHVAKQNMWFADMVERLAHATKGDSSEMNEPAAFEAFSKNLSRFESLCRDLPDHLDFLEGVTTVRREMGGLPNGRRWTDLEIIGRRGERRPRPSVVNRFEKEPREANAWLRGRMEYTAKTLQLNPERMERVYSRIVNSISAVVEERQNAVAAAALAALQAEEGWLSKARLLTYWFR